MAITFQYGTGAQSSTPTVFNLYPWAYTTAFRNVSDNGTIAKMSDVLAPLDKKTTAKVTLSKIANVYATLADGEVPVANQSANVSGGTVFAELKTIATKVVGSSTIYVPMVARVELRLPFDPDITESDVKALIMSTVGLMCDSAGSPVVITEKLRGALTPAGI